MAEGGSPAGGSGTLDQAGQGTIANDGGAGGTDADAPQTSADYCAAFGKALCTWRSACAQDDCLTWGGYQRFQQECTDAQASEAAGFLTFVPEVAVACLEVVDSESSTCLASGPPFFRASVTAACRGVFAGTVANGDECGRGDFASVFDECANGFCVLSAGECLGSCSAYLQADEDCTAGVCEPGLFCNDFSCGPPRALGEDCSASVCEAGLQCGGEPPTCRDPGPVGADCIDRFDCESPAECVDEKCAIDLGVGELCRTAGSCAAGLFCDYYATPAAVCATRLAPSSPCSSSIAGACVDGYSCSQVEPYVCVETLGGLNEPCGPYYACEGDLWCDSVELSVGTCRAPVPLDGECTQSLACATGLYCVGSEPAKCGPSGGSGEPCSVFEPLSCQGELFCARDTVTCAAPRAANETCNPSVAERACQDGLFCECLSPDCPTISSSHQPQDVCAPRRADGQVCTYGYECSGGYCVSQECTSTAPVTATCTRASLARSTGG